MSDRLTYIHGEEEWSALYVNGELDRVGDDYWVVERLHYLAGIDVRPQHGNDFLRGQTKREGVAPNLAAIEEFEADKAARLVTAERLRAHGEHLMHQADQIEAGEEIEIQPEFQS